MTATGRNVTEEMLTYFKALFQHFPVRGEGELPSDELSTSRDCNPGHPKYEAGFSTTYLAIECKRGIERLTALQCKFNFMENRY